MLPLVVVSLLWAFSFGLIKRHLGGVDAAFVATVRLGLALLVLLPFLRPRGLRPAFALQLVALGAVQFGLMYVCYIESFRFLRAYEAALFTITTPLFVTLLADALDRSFRPAALAAAALAVAATGLVVLRSTELKITLSGLLLVQASNFCFAAGQVWYRRLRRIAPDLRDRDIFALPYLGGCALALAVTAGRDISVDLRTPQLLTLLYLGAIASGLGFFLWNYGAARVSAGTLAVMNNAKVPLAVAVSLVVFGEQTDLAALAGSLAVMGAALWLAERPARPPA
jgi:drug/metabolite transporter (DMT)-like permease